MLAPFKHIFVLRNLNMATGSSKMALFREEVQEYLEKEFCNNQIVKIYGEMECKTRLKRLFSNLQCPPSVTVVRVNTLHFKVPEVKDLLQKVLEEQYQTKKPPTPEVKYHPVITDILLIPSSAPNTALIPANKEIVVDLVCATAIMRGADIFAPGVMGADPGIHKGDSVAVYADMESKCRRGYTKPYQGEKIFIGNGTALMSRADVFVEGKMSGTAVQMSNPIHDCPSLNSILPNHMFLQNLPSVVVSHVLDPQPGETVLDMCAAPGGKTTHLAALMKDSGVIYALEKSARKMTKIRENISRFGISCIKTFAFDSTKACDVQSIPGTVFEGPPFPAESFDRILLDTPCSALGQRPILRNNFNLSELISYPTYQRKLFTVAAKLLKHNGVLVYSTCTLPLGENEGLVEWALKTYPNLSLESQEPSICGTGMHGTSLSPQQLNCLQRCNPASIPEAFEDRNADNDAIGFFIAKFRKR